MKLVVFGLTISSSWGNGHATIWRGLGRGLKALGHKLVFFEKDVPYYAAHRDLMEPEGAYLVLYSAWDQIRAKARKELDDADAAIVTSYCPDAKEACELLFNSNAKVKCFYDLDTPVTLKAIKDSGSAPYIPSSGLSGFDLVLSYTGGGALEGLKTELNARRVAPLYGSVDPASHGPAPAIKDYEASLSYLGTYAEDRQAALERLFVEPATRSAQKRFIIGGALYPDDFPWKPNIYFVRHVPPPRHPSFYCSSAFTLNVTREAMARMGYCPSGRLFEAAACGVPVISDWWEGLDRFFEPGSEIVIARTSDDVMEALEMDEAQRKRIGRMARERTLSGHTALSRARELERLVECAAGSLKGETCGG